MNHTNREVTLDQILQAKEDRVRLQNELLRTYQCPLISFTMNIAGPVKNSPLIQRGFQEGLKALSRHLQDAAIRKCTVDISITGCQALYAVNIDAAELKKICIAIEDETPLGRLFDMDVLDTDGTKLERKNLRNCIVCHAPGRACASRRIHPVWQLQSVTNDILHKHFAQVDREQIAKLAVQSLLDEVYTTPKPGLVDRRNNGSHTDMNIIHFVASANALKPYFSECVKIGQDTSVFQPQHTFLLLRQAGIAAEKTMYDATGGVNTHKGAIYTLGILCGAIGRFWTPECPIAEIPAILSECAQMVRESVESDFTRSDGTTAGLRLYGQHGLTGIRGEVAAGLPAVANISLPVYKDGLNKGLSSNDAGVIALLHLIASVKDTNLYHRGGTIGAHWAAKSALALLENTPSITQIEELDDSFIARNLSPGGCADLLAVTYFIYSLYSQE